MFEKNKMIRDDSLSSVSFLLFSVSKNINVLYIFLFLLYKFVSNPNFNKVYRLLVISLSEHALFLSGFLVCR